jgi:nitrate reductase NapD
MDELHIAGCVAYVKPEAGPAITRAIHASRLAEVARDDGKGHLVVVIEGASAGKVMDVIDAIRALDGVLAVHLAYQHAEPASDLEELQWKT